jgi:periplasmic divalent cation tolerance protein
MNAEYVLALTTLPLDQDALGFARVLVDERLAACVNILPEMQSVYRWKGNVEQERERQLLIKTTESCLAALWERVRELHSYDVPEFIVLRITDGNDVYLRWIAESTGQAAE